MSIGVWQLVLILIVFLLLFGAGKVPNVMKDLAKGIKAFKQGLNDEDENEEKVSAPKVIKSSRHEKN
ncbi:MAG: twin-arginine translocase TatA/TatE family subunit [Alphaproteobacteria bacterium]|jgi:sec-independent protein translocase protein TatA|nr:twin-arginine translocase TatA/TatE family subunit [Alphaproteobacteria bacterium]